VEPSRVASGDVPSFDVVSELDAQEVRNAVDQVAREISTRFDFKGAGAGVELGKDGLTLRAATEDRLKALRTVVEEKFVRRKLSLKALDWGKVEEAAGGTVRQEVALKNGISADAVKDLNKRIKALGLKGVQSSGQGDSLRVTSKKRDELQAVQAALREADLDYPVQFTNRRD
jgi:cyclic-di-GMP-binding protein